MRRTILVLTAAMLGGCGGEFILTAPDVVVLAGRDAPVVVRLQRRELWRYAPPQDSAAVTFRLGDGPMRCARTDKAGYAAVSIEAPRRPGRYEVVMYHQDAHGDSITKRAAIYVLDPAGPAAVVDADSLPRDDKSAGQAAGALVRMQRSAQVVYVTEKYASRPARAHALLDRYGYPDGPVVPYRKPRWWLRWRRGGEAGALDELHRRLGKLRWGITADSAAANAFADAGLEVLVVGKAKAEDAEQFDSWADLKIISSE